MLSTTRWRRRDRQERAKLWVYTDLRSSPTLSAEEENDETLAAEPAEPSKRTPRKAGEW